MVEIKVCQMLKMQNSNYGFTVETKKVKNLTMPFVQKLVSHGPAEKSGVKPNDVIIRINGIETHSLRKRTIGSLIERFHVHVTIECIEDKDLENFSHSKIDSYPQVKPGNLRLPRIFKLHGNKNGDKINFIEKTRIMFAVSEYLNFTEGKMTSNFMTSQNLLPTPGS